MRVGPRSSWCGSPLAENCHHHLFFNYGMNYCLDEELYEKIKKERFYFMIFKDIKITYIPYTIVLLLIKAGIKFDFDFNYPPKFIIK